MGRVLADAERLKKIIAPVCHGQSVLLSATDEDGRWLFAGRRMTPVSDGTQYERRQNWSPYIVKDRNLVSGHNAASTAPLVEAVLAELLQRTT